MSVKNNSLLSIVTTLLLLLVTYFLFGYYYGWVDDVLVTNYLQGIPIYQPIDYTFDIHFLLSKVYRWLYQFFPNVPWVGIFMGVWIFLATFNLCFFFLEEFSVFFESKLLLIAIFVIVYTLIWVENVYLINFSRVAILLMGTSFINIHRLIRYSEHKKGNVCALIYFSITFLIGLLTRMQTIFIIMPLLGVYSFWAVKKKYDGFKSIAIVAFMMFMYITVDSIYFNADPSTRKTTSHILNIVDGLNTYNTDVFSLARDVKNLALFHYYFPDTFLVNSSYLESLGPSSAFNWIGLNHISRNLLSEYWKATYYTDQYHKPLNWFWKSVWFSVFNCLLLLVSVYRALRDKVEWSAVFFEIILVISFYSTVFLITVLSKMEDRVLNPAFIIFSVMHLTMWSDKHFSWIKSLNPKVLAGLILIPLILLSALRVNGYLIVSGEKKHEMSLKKDVLEEINSDFNGKMIFYDLWTMTLLHQTPLETIHLSPHSVHTCYGEYWSNVLLLSHRKYLKELCGEADFVSFYKCLYHKREKVVFVFSKPYRKDLIERYARDIYGEKVVFKEVKPQGKIKNIHHSFLWGYNEFGYYEFDKSFSDAR